jgi:hypothetical protein
LQPFDARDLTIDVEAVTCCEHTLPDDAAGLTNPSFRPWKNETDTGVDNGLLNGVNP